MISDDLRAAAHELGHAFAGREAGYTLDRLEVSAGEGRCVWQKTRIYGADCWSAALAIAGGQAAEHLYVIEEDLWPRGDYGTEVDEENFVDLRTSFGDAWPSWGSFAAAVHEAETLIRGVWDELAPLIPELAANGRLASI